MSTTSAARSRSTSGRPSAPLSIRSDGRSALDRALWDHPTIGRLLIRVCSDPLGSDAAPVVVRANERAATLHCTSVDDLEGVTWIDRLAPVDRKLLTQVTREFRDGRVETWNGTYKAPSGTTIDLTLTPLGEPSRGGVVLLADLVKLDAVALHRAREAAEDLCATANHELRTPVASVLGYTELLLAGEVGPLEGQQRDFVERVHRNAQRLHRLIDQFTAVAAGARPLTRTEPAPLDTLLAEVVEGGRAAVDGRLTLRGPEPWTGLLVDGSPPSIRDALRRVVDNAVEFTGDGGLVTVTVDHRDDLAVITISDTGLGIPEQDLPHVFEPFSRSSLAHQQAVQGAGLGLTIVQSTVVTHRGSLDIASREGGGTDVVISLPVLSVEPG